MCWKIGDLETSAKSLKSTCECVASLVMLPIAGLQWAPTEEFFRGFAKIRSNFFDVVEKNVEAAIIKALEIVSTWR